MMGFPLQLPIDAMAARAVELTDWQGDIAGAGDHRGKALVIAVKSEAEAKALAAWISGIPVAVTVQKEQEKLHAAPFAVAAVAIATSQTPDPVVKSGCCQPEQMYLICKHGGYYRPNCQGYTSSIAEAGRYTLAEAISETHPNGPDGPRDGMSYIPATDLAAVPAQVKEHEQDLIIRDLTMMLIRAARHVPDDQMEGVFDYMRRKGIDHGPLRAAVEPQPVPLQAQGAKPLHLSDDLRGQLWQIVLKMTACDDDGCGQNNCSCMARYARILAALEPLPTILHIGWGQALSQVYKPQPDPRTADYEQAYQYALTLADALIAKHYPDNKDWRPLGDLTGLLTQIDNMVADKMPDPRDEVIARLVEALEGLSAKQNSVLADVSSAHSNRGAGASGGMRDDDRDFRRSLESAFDVAAAALAAAKAVQHG